MYLQQIMKNQLNLYCTSSFSCISNLISHRQTAFTYTVGAWPDPQASHNLITVNSDLRWYHLEFFNEYCSHFLPHRWSWLLVIIVLTKCSLPEKKRKFFSHAHSQMKHRPCNFYYLNYTIAYFSICNIFCSTSHLVITILTCSSWRSDGDHLMTLETSSCHCCCACWSWNDGGPCSCWVTCAMICESGTTTCVETYGTTCVGTCEETCASCWYIVGDLY